MASVVNTNKTYNNQLKVFLESKPTDTFIDTQKDLWINEILIDITNKTLISGGITNTGTQVYKFNGLRKYKDFSFIVKYTPYTNEPDKQEDLRFENECKIYTLMRKLIEDNVCPFVYYAFECKNKEDYNDTLKNIFTDATKPTATPKPKHIYMSVLKTSKISKKLMSIDKLVNEKLTEIEFLVIVFQIMYTLKCFSIIGLKHNDLHTGNIMVEIDENVNVPYKYNIFLYNGKTYKIPITKHTIKIFDFDLSLKFERKGKNLKTKYEESYKSIDYNKLFKYTIFLKSTDTNIETYDMLNIFLRFFMIINISDIDIDIKTYIINLLKQLLNINIDDIEVEILKIITKQTNLKQIKKKNETKKIKNSITLTDKFDIDYRPNTEQFNPLSIDNILDILNTEIIKHPINPKYTTPEETYSLNNLYNSKSVSICSLFSNLKGGFIKTKHKKKYNYKKYKSKNNKSKNNKSKKSKN
jgi:hypothetical protein